MKIWESVKRMNLWAINGIASPVARYCCLKVAEEEISRSKQTCSEQMMHVTLHSLCLSKNNQMNELLKMGDADQRSRARERGSGVCWSRVPWTLPRSFSAIEKASSWFVKKLLIESSIWAIRRNKKCLLRGTRGKNREIWKGGYQKVSVFCRDYWWQAPE